VLSPDFYDPGLNPLYRDVLAHYGVTALPCKVRDPDRKGKVESGVAHAQKTPLKGKKFESLEEAHAYLLVAMECCHGVQHYAATGSIPQCTIILPPGAIQSCHLIRLPNPAVRRHGDFGRSNQAVRCG
jgi:hypothetical protein